MAIKICGYVFEGPYTSTSSLEDRSGVYAILCSKDDLFVIDVGESATVRTRVETHDRKDCWKRHCKHTIVYAAHYTPGLEQPGRQKIEKDVRKSTNPPCGEQ